MQAQHQGYVRIGKYRRPFVLSYVGYGQWHLWLSLPGERIIQNTGERHWIVNHLRVERLGKGR